MALDPAATYVVLDAKGSATQVEGGDAFWSQPEGALDALGRAWLFAEFSFDADWPSWEVHPLGDELVYVLEGDVEFWFETDSGIDKQRVTRRGLVVVPRGTWHTAKVFAPSRLLHVTMGDGSQHKPA